MSSGLRGTAGALVGAVFVMIASVAPAAADCFTRSNVILPTAEKVRAKLSNGEAGQRIYDAVVASDIAEIETLARADPTLLTTRTVLAEGERPSNGNFGDLLTFAVATCDPLTVGVLLELGADPNGAIPGSALTYAVLADDPVMAVMLLQAGAAPDAHDLRLRSPMIEALMFERADAVALLGRAGADVNRAETFGHTPLLTAIRSEDWQSAKALVDAGANTWQVGNQGALPAERLAAGPPRSASAKERRLHAELLARAEAQAPFWPPPIEAEIVENFVSGTWPTPDMQQAGFVASDGAMRSMQMVSRARN